MNKKFLSAILFGALMVTSTGTFVSCKDYDDDIDGLQTQVDSNKSALDSQLASLNSAAAAAQAAADAAKAVGNEAKAAAAQAKVDAIADATAKVEALKVWVAEQGYATKEELAVAIAVVNGQIEGIEGGLSELADYAKGLEEQLGTLSTTTLSNIVALQEDLDTQKAAIEKLLNSTTDEALAAQLEDVLVFVTELEANVGQSIGNLGNRLDDLEETLTAKFESQDTFFAQLSQVVNTLVADVDTNKSSIEELWAEINGEGANSIRTQLGQLAGVIATVQGELATLHTLVDSSLTSLAFIPEVINHHGLGVVEFYSLELEDADGETVYVSNVPTATYRVNPTNAAQADYTWSFINRAVTTRAAGDATDLLTVTKSEAAAGSRTFWLQVNKDVVDTYANDNKKAIFALKAANGEREIVSDYATVTVKTLKDFALAQLDEDGQMVKFYSATEPAITTTADVELVYTSTLDLNPIVEAWSTTTVLDALVDLNVEGIEYEFEMVEEYLGADLITDQQKFITLDKGVVAVDKTWLNNGTAAIGRTPVIKAVATVNGLEIATGFIKVVIVKEPTVAPTVKEDLVINVALGDIDYTEIATGNDTYKLDWTRVNAEIYDVLGLTKSTFATKYVGSPFTLVPQGVTAGTYLYNNTQTTESAFAYIQFSDQVNLGDFHVNVTFKANDNYAYPNVVVKFTYNIVHTPSIPALNPDYLIGTNIIQVKGRMEGGAWKLISDMNEHFTNYLAGYTLPGNHTDFKFRLKDEDPAQTGVKITGTNYRNQVIELMTPFAATETSRDYNIEAVVTLANGKECVYDYVVRFVRPFNATVDAMTLKTFIANPDSKDLAELVVIKDLDGEVLYEEGLFTQYAKDTYNIDATSGITFDYDIDFDATFGNKLSISGSEVTWYNGGADLQQNKTAASVVTITIPNIATIESEGVITVLSTENSKK